MLKEDYQKFSKNLTSHLLSNPVSFMNKLQKTSTTALDPQHLKTKDIE